MKNEHIEEKQVAQLPLVIQTHTTKRSKGKGESR